MAGYRLYERGRFGAAHACLLIYGYLIASSLGHFLVGSPDELTTRGLVSVFVDLAAGLTVMGVAVWSMVSRRGRAQQRPGAGPAFGD